MGLVSIVMAVVASCSHRKWTEIAKGELLRQLLAGLTGSGERGVELEGMIVWVICRKWQQS